MKNNNAENVALYILGYFVLLLISLLFYSIFASFAKLELIGPIDDTTAVVTGLLSWSATLYAPIIAILLFANWRKQSIYSDAIKTISEIQDDVSDLEQNAQQLRQQATSHLDKLVTVGVELRKELLIYISQFEDAYDPQILRSQHIQKTIELRFKLNAHIDLFNNNFEFYWEKHNNISKNINKLNLMLKKEDNEISDNLKIIECIFDEIYYAYKIKTEHLEIMFIANPDINPEQQSSQIENIYNKYPTIDPILINSSRINNTKIMEYFPDVAKQNLNTYTEVISNRVKYFNNELKKLGFKNL